MTKYSKKAQSKIKKVMREYKSGTLKSGKSGATVKSRKQAEAIGISEARAAGYKTPAKKGATPKKRTVTKRTTAKRSPAKRTVKRTVKRKTAKRK